MRILFALVTALLLTASCSKSRRADVPRPYGFPRIEIPDSTYTDFTRLPISVQVNSAAEASLRQSEGENLWADILYPGLNAGIYLTYQRVADADELASAIDNRTERIALNLGGNDAEVLSFASRDFNVEIYVSQGAGATPVQFMAVSPEAVLSGVSFMPGFEKENYDSLRPVVDMLRRDVIHMMKTLGQ